METNERAIIWTEFVNTENPIDFFVWLNKNFDVVHKFEPEKMNSYRQNINIWNEFSSNEKATDFFEWLYYNYTITYKLDSEIVKSQMLKRIVFPSEAIELIKEMRQRLLFDIDSDGQLKSPMSDLMHMWDKVNNLLSNQQASNEKVEDKYFNCENYNTGLKQRCVQSCGGCN